MNRANDEGVGARDANPSKTLNNQRSNSASDGGDSKAALSTMQAKAALRGCTLLEMADGGFVLCRWNCCKAMPCLRAVGNLLRQIGAC
jgi:hypothetical protein